MRETTL